MAEAPARHMIAYDLAPGRFSFRAGAIILRDGHVLATRTTTETIWYPPGGRVEWGESTRVAVQREIVEELGMAGEVGELTIMLESFFTYRDKRFHELAYYYPVTLPDDFPFRTDGEVCHRGRDGEVDLEFKWLRTDAESLRANDFKPEALYGVLYDLPVVPRHVIWVGDGEESA